MLLRSLSFTGLFAGLLLSANGCALSLGDLSQSDATGGLKEALTQGAQTAGKQWGGPGGGTGVRGVGPYVGTPL